MEKLTYKEIAKRLKCNPSTAFRWLNKTRRPSPQMAMRLEKLTGVVVNAWLFPDEYFNPYIK
jgi:transcriptional regulator with XRE-family HTH domain